MQLPCLLLAATLMPSVTSTASLNAPLRRHLVPSLLGCHRRTRTPVPIPQAPETSDTHDYSVVTPAPTLTQAPESTTTPDYPHTPQMTPTPTTTKETEYTSIPDYPIDTPTSTTTKETESTSIPDYPIDTPTPTTQAPEVITSTPDHPTSPKKSTYPSPPVDVPTATTQAPESQTFKPVAPVPQVTVPVTQPPLVTLPIVVQPPPVAPPVAAAKVDDWKLEMLTLVNEERKKADLEPLCFNAKLNAAADAHSRDMSDHGDMTHAGSNASNIDFGKRFDNQDYDSWSGSENIARGQSSVAEVMEDWMKSSGHRANILGNFNHFGAGEVNQYWTQNFGASNEPCS